MFRTLMIAALLSLSISAYAQDTKPAPKHEKPDSNSPEAKEKLKKLLELRDQHQLKQARERSKVTAKLMIESGAKFLLSAQNADGAWSPESGPGITELCALALIQAPNVGPDHDAVKKAIEFILRSQRDDGGIYSAEGLEKNYESSIALRVFAAMKSDKYKPQIDALQKFLITNQWDESEGKSRDDVFYGGAGYGKGQRPDLSNLQMMLDALHDSGLPPESEAYKKALVFIQRCQMLGESNDQPFAKGSTQGGFIYSAAKGGESKTDPIEVDGRKELRSYGSMTYAGFKSLLYCGLAKDDPRVKAALGWIAAHWTLESNPNMPEKQSKEGLFYYYHAFARALAAYGEDVITDHGGNLHDWRVELIEKLTHLQRSEGGWVNEADRWMESIPSLTTAYSMLALETAYPQQK